HHDQDCVCSFEQASWAGPKSALLGYSKNRPKNLFRRLVWVIRPW
ncbi:hypothetical protein CMV_012572, partial [Castanea mollissima]